MAKGDRVTRSAFNNLQSQVANIMGVGSGQTGYGQLLISRQANPGEVISSSLLSNLRTDMAKAWTHQTNTSVVNSSTVGPPNLKLYSAGDVVSDFLTQYSDFVNNGSIGINIRKNLANSAQMSSGITLSNTQRTTQWGGSTDVISHTVTVTFSGYTQGSLTVSASDHARVFFNAGGSIQVNASRSGGSSTSKNTTWTNMLSGFGTFSFGYTSSSISGSLNSGGSIESNIGFFDLTVGAGATTMLIQTGPGGVYAENDYIISIRRPTSSTIEFTIFFRDDDAGDKTGEGPAVDEEVNGTLTSLVSCTRPAGANVDVPSPSATATAL